MANKFNARKVELDGITFQSQAEARRYGELKWLERAGDIKALVCHPRFPLTINGVTIGTYTGDFLYYTGGRKTVEDVKGRLGEAASLRLRVFKACYPEISVHIHTRGESKVLKQRKVAA
jgi:hypothetical protein